MEIHGNHTISMTTALSALSPGQKRLPVAAEPHPDGREEGDPSVLGARLLEKPHRRPEPEKPPITYEERLKQMISADEMRRLMYLYSPFARPLLEQEMAHKGRRVDRTA